MAAEGGPGMPAVDPSGRTPVRSGDVEGVGNFDTTLFFFFFCGGRGGMQLSQFLLLIMCVWAVEGDNSTL